MEARTKTTATASNGDKPSAPVESSSEDLRIADHAASRHQDAGEFKMLYCMSHCIAQKGANKNSRFQTFKMCEFQR